MKPFLVGDEWRSEGRGALTSICPTDGSIVAEVAIASAQDVDDAVNAARAAFELPAWREMPSYKRAMLLSKFASLIERDAHHLATIQTKDNGKPLKESLAQATAAAEFFRFFAAGAETLESSVVPSRGEYFGFTEYEPVGVVAAITPWNSPLTLEAQKLAPILAAGNAVVLKSSEVTPQIGLEYARLALEAEFPPGIVNVVTGQGDVGRALVEHPGVDMITFTGGTKTGRNIAKAAGARGVPVVLELGGKSPNVVFADANLEHALHGVMAGIFHNAGQSCIAGSRVFIERAIYHKFVELLVKAVKTLVVGDPFDSRTDVASLSSFEHRDLVEAMLSTDSSIEVLCGGKRPFGEKYNVGAFFEPTVLAVENDHPLAQQEIFGPVACVIPFDDEEQLVNLANSTEFGLACGVWTESFPKALRMGRRIRSGMVWVNTYKITAVNMPFGGVKASGYGRECGIAGMRTYMAEKSYYVSTSRAPIPWPRSEMFAV
ncbi:betaine-aldehyde dehydrogenase [Pseudorhodoplanes sinuspersici]|uniref:Aldehyde dehydrogenase n=2 Tax=Pseudorhodoplanes sinuspersici TaxID=1235591 RepID=A0A1W6ZZG0_9HYPH|nr:aldehyde dehydrogenase [Pseudorhodoplanes sinuspersici]ARQ02713.1 aldehyde dehydrogenase [Pseudorhodoplanes sinuspersici]RKE68221.1 betaine-aldehyde dehydrogenase [Pseudorhodoplanes sinuspersici]